MANIETLHGPNLNLLGQRETQHYGQTSLSSIDDALATMANRAGHTLTSLQSNAEHELVSAIQQSNADFIIINPAAFTHTSIAIRDALSAVGIPFIECHLSNVFAREPFREHSYLSDIAVGVITGFGEHSYTLALQAAIHYLEEN